MDKRGYVPKYEIKRLDGKPLGRTFTIEIDKDPKAVLILQALGAIYSTDRPLLAEDCYKMARELKKQQEVE